jgi:hypothetical protein
VFKIAGSDDIAAAAGDFRRLLRGEEKARKKTSERARRQLRRKGTFSEASHAQK